jgi:DNA-binding MarR family transcriptional regulator
MMRGGGGLAPPPMRLSCPDAVASPALMPARPPRSSRPAAATAKPPALELGRFLPYVLHIAAESVSRLFATTYDQRFGLGVPEWRVMAHLGEGPARPTPEVIENTGMDPVKVSRAVTRLVDKGLAAREPNPNDQRAQLLRLTPQGLAVYGEIVPLARALLDELTEELAPQELEALHDMLLRLRARARSLAAGRSD